MKILKVLGLIIFIHLIGVKLVSAAGKSVENGNEYVKILEFQDINIYYLSIGVISLFIVLFFALKIFDGIINSSEYEENNDCCSDDLPISMRFTDRNELPEHWRNKIEW